MLVCSGWLPMTFAIQYYSTKQPLYICEKVDSCKACTDLNILHSTFPFPMDQPKTSRLSNAHPPFQVNQPYEPTEKNIPKLKQYLLDQFASTTFNTEGSFLTMDTKPAHIHINDEATPYVQHTPILPFHLKEAVKNSLDNDVRKGIITPVPIGTPIEWCITMVITPKKNGKICRTIDLQHLNRQCKRETHHCPSTSIMQPFRSLVKRNKFYWDETLDQLFQDSIRTLISAVEDGIRAFDYQHTTCLQTDWSKEGIGYLLQKHCKSTEGTAPICCPDGWKLIYAGSRFTTETESRYAPTVGEALTVAWSLKHAKIFVLGCKDLIVTTDHKPLLGIFNYQDLGSISNPCIQKLRSRTLRFRFTTQYCLGKWLCGPDALSQNPSTIASLDPLHITLQAVRQQPLAAEISQSSHLDINGTNNATTAINSFQDTNHHDPHNPGLDLSMRSY